MTRQRGHFITVEGIEGVGKSTHVESIARYLRQRGLYVVVTREPGGTPMAERIRQLILETPAEGLSATGELLLMFAARSEHLQGLIRPELEAGTTVVCDRFTDASYAYQGGGRGLAVSAIAQLEALVQQGLQPDLTLLLDASPELSAQRISGRDWHDRFEQERAAFFQRARQSYLQRAAAETDRIHVIDAAQSLESVQAAVESCLQQYLESVE